MIDWKWWYRLEDLEDLLENSHDLQVILPGHYLVMGHVFKTEEFWYETSMIGRAKWIKRFARCIQKDIWYASLADIFTIIGYLLDTDYAGAFSYKFIKDQKFFMNEDARTRLKDLVNKKWSYEDALSFPPLETAARELGMSDGDVERVKKRIRGFDLKYSEKRECDWLMGEIKSHTEASTVRMTRDFFSNLKNSAKSLRNLWIYGPSVSYGSSMKRNYSSLCWEALCEAVASLPSLHKLDLHYIDVMESVDGLAQLGNALASTGCMVGSLKLNRIKIHPDGLKCFFEHLSGSKLKTMYLGGLYRLETDQNDLTNDIDLNIVKLGLEELRTYGFVNDFILQFMGQLIQSPNQHLLKLQVDAILKLTPGLEALLDAVPHSKLEDLNLDLRGRRQVLLYDKVGKILQDPNGKLKSLTIIDLFHEVKNKFPRTFCEGLIQSTTLRSLHLNAPIIKLGHGEFGDAIKMSKLTELKLGTRTFSPCQEPLLEGIVASGIKILDINVSQNLAIFCRLMIDNPACSIENMELGVKDDMACKTILEVLDGNYSSQLQKLTFYYVSEQTFDWDPLERKSNSKWNEKAAEILKRNKLLKMVTQNSVKEGEVVNLYLCGSTRAGKTTIKCNLTRKLKLACYPACIQQQQHESTSGIELKHLSFPGTKKKFLIWDLAGQLEFHAFHHSFLRKIDNSIFLLVLKVATDMESDEFQKNVVYGLRFISSHTSSSSLCKPRVLIVLNFFESQPSPDTCLAQLVQEKTEEYKDILDIDIDHDIFPVEATEANSLKGLKNRLGKLCEVSISQQHKVPGLFQDAQKLCRQLKQSAHIKTTIEIGEKLLAGQQNMSMEDKSEMIKFTLSYLHNIGEVVYFGTNDLMSTNVILNVQWFVHKVISLFIDASKIRWWNVEQQKMNIIQVADHLKHHYGANKVEFILGCLYEMGIILPMDESWNGNWHPLPKIVMVPGLLRQKKVYFSKFPDGEGYKYWGRRVECEDVKFKLFPAGIFARMQSRIHQECRNPSFEVGNGWVIFQENRVHVLVSMGGDTDSWKDRQWVDIMVITQDSLKAELMMDKMNSCIVECCFGEIEIAQQKVLSSMYIKGRIHGESNSHSQDAVHLSVIKDEAIEHGLKYSHTWGSQRDDLVSDLLFPSEQEKCAKKIMIELCNDYQSLVRVVYDSPPLDSSIPSVPNFKDDEMQKLANFMGEMSRWQERRTREQLIEITSKLEGLAKQVYTNTSRLLHSLKVDCPKYPFLVTRDNRFMQYLKLVTGMKLVKIQYMCEFDRGAHAVTDVDGITLTISPEWLRRWSPVLIPSLIVLFTAAKVGTFFIPGAMFMNEILEESKKGMLEFLKGNVVMKDFDVHTLKESKPTQNDLKEMFVTVQKQSGVTMMMFETETMMRKNFGLTWSPTAGAWLCDKHLLDVTN